MNDSTNSSTGRRRKNPRSRALLVAGLVVVAAGAWYGVHKYRASKAGEGEYIYAAVTNGDIEDLVTSTGTLEPRDYVDVGAQVSGQIEKLNVEVGDVVKEGDILASIDATSSEARVEANRASLKSQETNLVTQINNRDKAKRDYERQQNLFKEDATTEETLVNAKTTYENAERQIIQQQASIEQQKANMRIEENNLKYTQIKAPISGTVMSIAVKQGQTLNATQNVPTVMRVANLGTMTVRSEVSEADVAKLYKGIQVYFTTLGGGNRRWNGTLKRIEPTPKVQNSVVLYNALFDVENEGNALMPSMTAQVFFVVAEARNVLTVPMAALQQGQQIARQLAAKEREEKAAAAKAESGKPADAAGATATAANGAREGGSVPATAQANAGAQPNGGAPGAQGAGANQGNRPNGGFGQGGNRPGGQRPGGGFGGFNGGQAPTPEQIEQFRRMRAQNGGQGGFGGGNFAGMNGGGMGGGQAAGRPQRRNGVVMIKQADGKLESRRIVVGVTDRVHGQVLEGLKEGEEVVVGKREANPAPAAAANPQQNNNNQNFRPNNFQGGGNFRF